MGLLCHIVGMMPKVFMRSKTIQQYCVAKRNIYLYRSKQIFSMQRILVRRYRRSLRFVRVKFGSTNFIQSLTPLTCVDPAYFDNVNSDL